MAFRSVFLAVVLGTALIVAALVLHSERPEIETAQPTAAMVAATGKCATCHLQETGAVVHEFRRSAHARKGVNCLDCHRPLPEQEAEEHRGFTISTQVTAASCAQCHRKEYDQFLRSRHAAPAFAAVRGSEPFTDEQIAHAERFHPGAVDRPPNALAVQEGEAAMVRGCDACHSVGRPNADGSIGTCTACHARHQASVALAREPETCGQCHMGPDHSQLEIFNESKHGALFNAQHDDLNLDAPPKDLGVEDMWVPSCATCHMSGLEGQRVTHDVTERLSYWLFAEVSEKRPTYAQGQAQMQEVCLTCHTTPHVERFYEEAEAVLEATNEKVAAGMKIVADLRAEGLLTPEPFDEPIEFVAFDFWHYYGRTAKHGAFMGGPDFVQWHGNYELEALRVELETMAREIRSGHAAEGPGAGE
ncbi:MAG: ammonia-forming cytochrome c nitrite reductase subunit c552 [Thermoanaerobaculia bacterium]